MIAIRTPPDNPVRRFPRWTGSLVVAMPAYRQRTIGRRTPIVRLKRWAR